MSSKLQLDVVTTIRVSAIQWTRTKAKGRHGVVCRLNCVIHVWAPWGRDTCHSERYINPCTFTLLLSYCTIAANYWQTRSIARPLCDSRATCITMCKANSKVTRIKQQKYFSYCCKTYQEGLLPATRVAARTRRAWVEKVGRKAGRGWNCRRRRYALPGSWTWGPGTARYSMDIAPRASPPDTPTASTRYLRRSPLCWSGSETSHGLIVN